MQVALTNKNDYYRTFQVFLHLPPFQLSYYIRRLLLKQNCKEKERRSYPVAMLPFSSPVPMRRWVRRFPRALPDRTGLDTYPLGAHCH